MQIGGKVVEIGGGFISGLFFDDQLNKLFNRPSNSSLSSRITDSLQSEFLSKFFEFIAYMWS